MIHAGNRHCRFLNVDFYYDKPCIVEWSYDEKYGRIFRDPKTGTFKMLRRDQAILFAPEYVGEVPVRTDVEVF